MHYTLMPWENSKISSFQSTPCKVCHHNFDVGVIPLLLRTCTYLKINIKFIQEYIRNPASFHSKNGTSFFFSFIQSLKSLIFSFLFKKGIWWYLLNVTHWNFISMKCYKNLSEFLKHMNFFIFKIIFTRNTQKFMITPENLELYNVKTISG